MRRFILLLALLAPCVAWAQDPLGPSFVPVIDTTCGDYPSNVWVSGPLQKIYQNTGNAPTCPGTDANKWITINGTQNEIVDFQVHIHDTGSGTTGFVATVSSFVQTAPNSFTIAAPDATHRDTVVYLEDYVHVTPPSAVVKTGTPPALATILPGGAGFIPDILVPAIDPYYHQTTNAMPMNIVANQNQSVWVDVHIPSTAPAGYYKGTVTLSRGCTGAYPGTGCTVVATLPIIIGVWQWPSAGFMPSTATLEGWHWSGDSSACAAFYNTGFGSACGTGWPGAGGDTTKAQFIALGDLMNLYSDHRMQLAGQTPASPSGANWTTYIVPHFTGTANTILPGAKNNTFAFSRDGGSPQTWSTVFQSGGWTTNLMFYGCDEPATGCDFVDGPFTVATLPTSRGPGTLAFVTDGSGASCTVGGGSTHVNCQYNGTTWIVITNTVTGGWETMWRDVNQALQGSTPGAHSLTPTRPMLSTTSFSRLASGNGSGQSESTMCTTGFNSVNPAQTATCLQNSIDWMVPNVNDMSSSEWNNLPAYRTWRAGSSIYGTPPPRKWWAYNACDSNACGQQNSLPATYYLETPATAIDNTPIANRVSPWFDFYSGQTGELYYADSICWGATNCDGPGFTLPSGTGDPWIYNAFRAPPGAEWGAGTQVYPGRQTGTPTGFPSVGVTNPIMLPSIRLKMWRDGAQDYEYMTVLTANGKGSVVTTALNSVLVTAPGATGVSAWSFNNTLAPATGSVSTLTSDLPDARATLGTAMHQLTFAGSQPWSGLCAPSRCTDWTNAGVLDPVTGLSEAKGGGIPHYPTGTGTITTVAAYGQNNAGKATPDTTGQTMTVTAVTAGTGVTSYWSVIPHNLVTLNQGIFSGNYVGQGAGPFVFTCTSGPDSLSTNWVGKTLWLTTSGTPRGAIVTAVSGTACNGVNTVTYASQPKSSGNSPITDGATQSSQTQTFGSTITAIDTVNQKFTIAGTPTIAVGSYSFAGGGDVTGTIANGGLQANINACSGTPGNGNVILLGPGTFFLNSSPTMVGIHDCVLRGTNPNLVTLAEGTIINYVTANSAGGNCGGFPAGVCFADTTPGTTVGAYPILTSAGLLPSGAPGGTNANPITGTGANIATWTGAGTTSTTVVDGTYTPGSTWIRLSNVGSAGLDNGQPLTLDQEDAALTSPAAGGYDWCTRLGWANYTNLQNPTTTSCNQEVPFGARGGIQYRGKISLAGNIVTWVSGAQFVTGGAWTNAMIYLNGGLYTIGAVNDAQHISLAYQASGAGPPTNPCNPTTTTNNYLDTNSGGSLYVCPFPPNPATWSPVAAATYPYLINYRGQSQTVNVVSGCPSTAPCSGTGPYVIQISDPLIGQNWSASLFPGAWFPTGHSPTSSIYGWNAGVEDLTIDQDFNLGNTTTTSVGCVSANNIWVKGIRSLHGDRSHVALQACDHASVVNSYFVGTKKSTTQSYAIETDSSSHILFENNICQQIVSCMTPDGNTADVFAYNFSINNHVTNSTWSGSITHVLISGGNAIYTFSPSNSITSGINFTPASVAGISNNGGVFNFDNVFFTAATSITFTIPTTALSCSPSCPVVDVDVTGLFQISNSVMSGMYTAHSSGNRYALFEENIGSQFHTDTIHGSARTQVAFGNYLGGNEKNIKQNLSPFRFESMSRYYSLIGNVLGSPAQNGYNTYFGCTTGCSGTQWIYWWITSAVNEQQNNILPETFSQSTSYRWGNYDIITGPGSGTQFNAAEVPTTDTFGYAQSVPSCASPSCFPNSFYLPSKPAFLNTQFGSVPYPPIGPGVVGGTAMSPDMLYTNTPPGGHAFDNAASKVWQNAPIDPNYVGYDGGIRLFSETMYSPAAGAAATLTPNPLAFGNQNVGTTSPVNNSPLFQNTGSTNVTIASITVTGAFSRSGGSCTVALVIAPGNNCNIGVTFSPSVLGFTTGVLSVSSNAAGSPQQITLNGTGTQATIQWVSPQGGGTTYNFGSVPIGSFVDSAPITLNNIGTGPLNVSTPFPITGTGAARFVQQFTTCASVLAAGANCTVIVRFTPAAATSYTASMTETDSLASNSPQVFTLNGSGSIPVPNIVAPCPWCIIQGGK